MARPYLPALLVFTSIAPRRAGIVNRDEAFFATNPRNTLLKKTIILAALASCCVACASNQPTDTAGDTSATASSKPAKESNCKYVRSSGGLSRIRRACQPVDTN